MMAAWSLSEAQPDQSLALSEESFVVAQQGVQTSAATALAQMAARFAKGDGELSRLIREQQNLVEAWQRLVELVQPQLIVMDYAPTLCLAAYQELPVVQVGNWFPMVPVDQPTFPLLVPGQRPAMPQEALAAIVQEVQRRRGRAIPPALTSVMAIGDRFPTLFAELDPYGEHRRWSSCPLSEASGRHRYLGEP